MKIGDTIYLDHQATTPVDSGVLSAMLPYFKEEFGNPHSSNHILGWKSSAAVEKAATCVGRMVGADPDEVFFTSGATEANNLALLGFCRRAAEGSRRRLLLSATEHKSVLAVAHILEQQHGFTVGIVPVDKEGFLNLTALKEMLDENVLLLSVMAVNNEIGTIQDIAHIARIAAPYNTIIHCDAAQAPVTLDLHEAANSCDLMSLSAHKIYGPKGIGALVVSRELQNCIEPLVYGGDQQLGLRSGTVPVPLCVGMGAACDLLSGDVAFERRARLCWMRDRFANKMCELPWAIAVNGPVVGNERHIGNLNLRFPGFSAEDMLAMLQPRLAAATGSACTTGMPEPSHVLRAIGLSAEEAESSIRFSLGFDTTAQDIDDAISLIDETLSKLSKSMN